MTDVYGFCALQVFFSTTLLLQRSSPLFQTCAGGPTSGAPGIQMLTHMLQERQVHWRLINVMYSASFQEWVMSLCRLWYQSTLRVLPLSENTGQTGFPLFTTFFSLFLFSRLFWLYYWRKLIILEDLNS